MRGQSLEITSRQHVTSLHKLYLASCLTNFLSDVACVGSDWSFKMPFVRSSAIARIEWVNGVLSVWFHDSGRYDYFAVPEKIFEAFLASRSKGTFFNDHIRDRF